MPGSSHRLVASLGVFVGSLALSLVAGEALLRLLHPIDFMAPPEPLADDTWRSIVHRESDTPGLSYELVPGRTRTWHGFEIAINSHGMRDREPAGADTAVRVAAVGDSFAFGFGVSADESWPSVVEATLASQLPEPAIDVLNFGVSGYSTVDEAAVVDRKLPPWKPRVIVLGYVMNDPEAEPIQYLHAHFAPIAWWQRFHLGRLGKRALLQWSIDTRGRGDYLVYLHDPEGATWRAVLDAFDAIDTAGDAMGAPVVLVLFPETPWHPWRDYPYREIHRQVAEAAQHAGMEVVDLLPHFSRHRPRRMRVSERDHHPTPLAHRVAGRLIADHLLDRHRDRLRR